MQIGQLVQRYTPMIFALCEHKIRAEFDWLQDTDYSKRTLDINYPFCKPVAKIAASEHVRYYSKIYPVRGVSVRVTSQWFDPPTSRSRPLLMRYLTRLGIDVTDWARVPPEAKAASAEEKPDRSSKDRFKGNPIASAQNLLVRNILSNLGSESFGEEHWRQVIDAFGKRCAYCGRQEGELLMDHVAPINKQSLGEHRLGNLVPSCKTCNAEKGDMDFRAFLSTRPERIKAIHDHMIRHKYAPITANARIGEIVELAHREVAEVAKRYIEILNLLIAESR